MITRVQELCRKLKPVLGNKIDRLWSVYLAESEPGGKAEIEQMLEMLAAKHLNQNYEHDRNPFPPPPVEFAKAGDLKLGTIYYGGKEVYPFSLKSSRPINSRRISDVPAPISYSLASRNKRPVG